MCNFFCFDFSCSIVDAHAHRLTLKFFVYAKQSKQLGLFHYYHSNNSGKRQDIVSLVARPFDLLCHIKYQVPWVDETFICDECQSN